MKHRTILAGAVFAACVAAGAGQLVDLACFTDPATGFVTAGPAALRYGCWLLLGVICLLAGQMAVPRPAALTRCCAPLGACMLATAAALAAKTLADLPALPADRLMLADVLTSLLAAVWFLRFGIRALRGIPSGRLPGAAEALPALLGFFWLLLRRFELAPAALDRLPCTVRVLSAAAAVWFAMLLVKVFLVPGLPFGRGLCAAGLAVFAYGTCLEMPRALWEAARGLATLSTVCTGLCMGALGLCGAVAAWCAMGENLPEEG